MISATEANDLYHSTETGGYQINSSPRIDIPKGIEPPDEKPRERVKFNPLLVSPSPRDIKEVLEAHRLLPYNMLYAKYFTERNAYPLLRDYFLKHKEYTHMIICPDDLLITPNDIETLKSDILQDDYPILSGICNVDLDVTKNFWSITENIPHPVRPLQPKEGERKWGWRWYSWYNDSKISQEQALQKRSIIQVWHSGFALQSLRRDVVESIEFVTDSEANGIENWESAGTDIMFSNSCSLTGIPIFADPRIRMLHLRKYGKVEITLGNGELRFYPANSSEYQKIEIELKQ